MNKKLLQHIKMVFATIGLLAGCFVALPVLKAETINICVICNEPSKVYQCTLDSAPHITPNKKGVQFACIQEIAQYGGHGQCATLRKDEESCQGEPYRLKNTAVLYQPPETGQPEPEQTVQPHKPNLMDDAKTTFKKTQKTVEKGYDSTKETVKKGYETTTTTVEKTAKKVGNSISDAASTTYECLTSFFKKCGD